MSVNSIMKLFRILLITLLAIISTTTALPHHQDNNANFSHSTDLKARECHEVPHTIPNEATWCHPTQPGWCTLTALISHPSYSAIGWVFSSSCAELGSNYALHCDPSIHSAALPWVTVVNTYESKLDLVEVWYFGSPTIRSWQGGCDCYDAWAGFEGSQDRICECRFKCSAQGPRGKREGGGRDDVQYGPSGDVEMA